MPLTHPAPANYASSERAWGGYNGNTKYKTQVAS